MARPKQNFCTNCNGENPKCKYLTTGRKCRIGKAKGKAVSDKTKNKREENDILIGDLHTDYLNDMRNRQITHSIDPETGEIIGYVEITAKYVSFERWLNMNGHRTLATYFRRTNENLKQFNFKDFNEVMDMEKEEFNELIKLENGTDAQTKVIMLKICARNNQVFMNNYIKKIDDMVLDYSKRGMNVQKYKEQAELLKRLGTPERIKEFIGLKFDSLNVQKPITAIH